MDFSLTLPLPSFFITPPPKKKCPPWEGERGKKGKCEHQQKNGCLASCIIFRNKQCETVLASLLAYTHKDRVSVPVSKIKGKHKKRRTLLSATRDRGFLKEIALWVNMWSPQIQSAQTKGISDGAAWIYRVWVCVLCNVGVHLFCYVLFVVKVQ